MADGRSELLSRFAEASAQLVASGLNDDRFTETQRVAIAEAVERGARFRMVVEFDPLAVVVQIVHGEHAQVVFVA
jgi:hypothetical protein